MGKRKRKGTGGVSTPLYIPDFDLDKLANPIQRVLALLLDGAWHSDSELEPLGEGKHGAIVAEFSQPGTATFVVEVELDPATDGATQRYRMDLSTVTQAGLEAVFGPAAAAADEDEEDGDAAGSVPVPTGEDAWAKARRFVDQRLTRVEDVDDDEAALARRGLLRALLDQGYVSTFDVLGFVRDELRVEDMVAWKRRVDMETQTSGLGG